MVAEAEIPTQPFRRMGLRELRERVDSAQGLIEAVRNAALEPNRTKVLRSFPATEICRYLGNISIDTLYRRLKKDSELPQGTQLSARRRVFSLEEIHALQRAFGITPRRQARRWVAALAGFIRGRAGRERGLAAAEGRLALGLLLGTGRVAGMTP